MILIAGWKQFLTLLFVHGLRGKNTTGKQFSIYNNYVTIMCQTLYMSGDTKKAQIMPTHAKSV